MDAPPTLHGPLARAYGAALHAVAVADGELQAIESARLDLLLERRCPGLDREDLFFERTTPEGFAAQRTPQPNQQQAMQPIRTDGEQLALRVAE